MHTPARTCVEVITTSTYKLQGRWLFDCNVEGAVHLRIMTRVANSAVVYNRLVNSILRSACGVFNDMFIVRQEGDRSGGNQVLLPGLVTATGEQVLTFLSPLNIYTFSALGAWHVPEGTLLHIKPRRAPS